MKTASAALQRSGSYHSFPPSLQTHLLWSCRTTLCAVRFFTQNISLHIFILLCLSSGAASNLCNNHVWQRKARSTLFPCCSAFSPQHRTLVHIYNYIYRDNNLVGFPQPSHSAAILTTNAAFIGFFERAATKSASKSDKWSGNKSWINDEVVPIRGSLAYMDRRHGLII